MPTQVNTNYSANFQKFVDFANKAYATKGGFGKTAAKLAIFLQMASKSVAVFLFAAAHHHHRDNGSQQDEAQEQPGQQLAQDAA